MTGPLYRQIADDLRRQIESGELEEGMQVPTEDQLMDLYPASRNTVRAALMELTTRGLVYKLHGKGTFISKHVNPIVITLSSDLKTGKGGGEGFVYTAEVAASGRSPSVEDPQVEIRKAGAAVGRLLQIAEETDVIIRRQKLYIDNLRWSLQTSYYPRSLLDRAPRLLDSGDIEEGTVSYMATCGIQQVGYRDAIQWRTPDNNETDFFDLPVDGHVQVVERRRIAFDQEGSRVRLTVTVYRADRNRFVLNIGDVPFSNEMYSQGELG